MRIFNFFKKYFNFQKAKNFNTASKENSKSIIISFSSNYMFKKKSVWSKRIIMKENFVKFYIPKNFQMNSEKELIFLERLISKYILDSIIKKHNVDKKYIKMKFAWVIER